jgi:hypothetical protein
MSEASVSNQLIAQSEIKQPLVLAAAATVLPAVLVVAGPTAALLVLNSLQALLNFPHFIANAWTHFLFLLGFKKRRQPWGKVINSLTSQAVSGAIVTIASSDNEGQLRVIDRSSTDSNGRYGFLVTPGNYVIQAEKIGFTFPTKVIRGVYQGHAFRIDSQQTVTLDLYCDPAEATLTIGAYIRRFISLLERFRLVFLALGTGLIGYSLLLQADVFNLVLSGLYAALWFNELLHRDSSRHTLRITDVTGRALPFVLFRLYQEKSSTAFLTKITDVFGEAYVLVPGGSYTIQIPSPRNIKGISQRINLPRGIVPKNMTIKIDY